MDGAAGTGQGQVAVKKKSRSNSSGQGKKDRLSRRNVVVMASLIGSLALTSVLLLAMSPQPLVPAPTQTLLETEQTDILDRLFQTDVQIRPGRWQYIYIHHSTTPSGDAYTLAQHGFGDHFVIGNGTGSPDGAIEVGLSWSQQQPPRLEGAQIGGNCISICLVGDFEQSQPTAKQIDRLRLLVDRLQREFRTPASRVLAYEQTSDYTGVGRLFPARSFRSGLLR